MSNIANHIAIIMDGNGRWAEQRGEKRIKGHEKGADTVRIITQYCVKHPDINRLTLYAFSTENWKRPKLEVEFLMKLLERYLRSQRHVYLENNIRFDTIGDISRFSSSLQALITEVKEETAHCDGLIQSLALNYGARDELLRSVKRIVASGEEISEEQISRHLDCHEEVDLLIRTGGDHRLSNFLLWQAAYAELFFVDTLWPDFTPEELEGIIRNFTTIERRFGGLK